MPKSRSPFLERARTSTSGGRGKLNKARSPGPASAGDRRAGKSGAGGGREKGEKVARS
jgi:hypothetical protein